VRAGDKQFEVLKLTRDTQFEVRRNLYLTPGMHLRLQGSIA